MIRKISVSEVKVAYKYARSQGLRLIVANKPKED